MFTGIVSQSSRHCHFDFPQVKVGCAEYPGGPTGCTVVSFESTENLVTFDIRGGSPAVTMGLDGEINAACFAGGSLYGLEASAGVTEAIARQWGQGSLSIGLGKIPVTRAACIYDFRRNPETQVFPDKALGRYTFESVQSGAIPLGPVGAGRSATVGKMGDPTSIAYESGGQGAAFSTFHVAGREFKVLVLVVVNSLGGIVNRSGQVVRGHLDRKSGRRLTSPEVMALQSMDKPSSPGNTTLSLVVTNLGVSDFYIRQAARQIHTSMARALDPFHTESDGDVLMMVRTAIDWSLDEELWSSATARLGSMGSELMWDSILHCWQ